MEYATTPRLTFVAFANQDRSAVCREQHALREKRNAAGAKQRFSRSDTISHISGYSAGEHHDSQPTKRHPMATKNTRELGDGHTDFHTDNRGSRTPAVSQRCSWSLQASGNHGNTTSSESTTFSDSPASRSIEDAGSQAALRQSRAGCHGLSVVPGRGSSESIASRAPSDDADPVEEREGLQNRLRRKLLSEKHLRCPPCSTRKGEDSFALRRNSGDSGRNAEPRMCTSAGEARVQSGLVLPTKGRVPQSELSSSLALCAAPHPVILLRSEEPGSVQRYGRLQSRGTALWWSKERQIERQADVRCALHQLRSRIYSTQRSDPGSRSSARVVQPTVYLPTTVFSAQRFISLHNMAIRYWDDGRPALAFRHARLARDLLKAHGLPFGCVGHLMKAMKDLQRPYAAVERRIHAAAKAKNSSVRAHFDLAQLFFAKRMLGSAATHLDEIRSRLSVSYSLSILQPPTAARDRKTDQLMKALAAVQDDILLVQELRMHFNSPVTCLADNYGGRLGGAVECQLPIRLLPCLSCRQTKHFMTGSEGHRRKNTPASLRIAEDNVSPRSKCLEWQRLIHSELLAETEGVVSPADIAYVV